MLWLAALLFFQAPSPGATPTFKVSGTIVREDKQEPDRVLNADRVLLRGNGTSMVLDIEAGGAFEFTRVRPGSYEIVVGPNVTMDPLKVVVGDKDVAGLRLVVPDRVVLRGTVSVDGDGPYPRFQLIFTRVDGTASASPPVSVAAGTSFSLTLSSGQYRISSTGLPAGYNLKSATLGDTDGLTQPMKLSSGDSPSLALTLGVASPPPWVKVRGRVVGAGGTGGSPSSVSMTGPGTAETLSTPIGPDGTFEFPRVLPGSYSARAVPLTVLSAAAALTVGTADIANLELRTPQPKEISGKIAIKGDVPMPRLAFLVGPAGSASSLPANPQPDGSFTVSLPEGEHEIRIVPGSVPAGYVLTSFAAGSSDLLKSPLRVDPAGSIRLNVNFDASAVRPVHVSGRVTGLLATKGVRVVLMSPILDSTEAAVNPDGSFAFSRVIPGNYNARLSLSGLSASTGVIVGTQDVSNVVLAYPREFVVTGHVIVERGGSADLSQITLEARPDAGRPVAATVSNAGVIMLNVKDGEYSISARNLPAGYRVKSIRYGTTDLQTQPLKVDGPVTWEIIVRIEN